VKGDEERGGEGERERGREGKRVIAKSARDKTRAICEICEICEQKKILVCNSWEIGESDGVIEPVSDDIIILTFIT